MKENVSLQLQQEEAGLGVTTEKGHTFPTVLYESTAEREGLPFAVDVNREKLGSFLEEIGFSDTQINKLRLVIGYKTPPSLLIVNKILDSYVYGKLLPDGSIFINARAIIDRTRSIPFKQFHEGLEGKEESNLRKLSRKISLFLVEQMIPELTEVPEKEQCGAPSRYWSKKIGIAARNTNRHADAVKFLDSYTTRSLQKTLQLAIPHELLHLQQEKPSKTYLKTMVIACPLVTLAVLGSVTLADEVYKLAVQSNIPLFSAAKYFLAYLAGGSGIAATFIKGPWVVKKIIGGEKEAYHNMHTLEAAFADVIVVRRTNCFSEEISEEKNA